MECFLPTCSEDRVDSPDPGHSARRVLSPAEARRGWVTFGRGTTGSGRRRKASGPPGAGGLQLHRTFPGGGAAGAVPAHAGVWAGAACFACPALCGAFTICPQQPHPARPAPLPAGVTLRTPPRGARGTLSEARASPRSRVLTAPSVATSER